MISIYSLIELLDILLGGAAFAKNCCAAEGVPGTCEADQGLQSRTWSRQVCLSRRHCVISLTLIIVRFSRHLYALYCLMQREREGSKDADMDSPPSSPTSSASTNSFDKPPLPTIFTDPGWQTLSTSILSTSNCGNPALRLFGFGPVAADGYGIGYIIKDEGISVYEASRLSCVKCNH